MTKRKTMSDTIQLIQGAVVKTGDVCYQVSARMDYTDDNHPLADDHFLQFIQPIFDEAAKRCGVTFGPLAVDVIQNEEGDDLFRATATAK